MQARDVMTTDVLTVPPDAEVSRAAELMVGRHVSALPVVEPGGRVVGIVSEGDLMHRAETGTGHRHRSWWLRMFGTGHDPATEYVRAHGRHVSDVMSRDPVSVTPETELNDIADLLERRRIKRVLVMDGSRLVGLVSRADLLRALVASRPALASAAPADDRTIRERILETIRREHLAASPYVNVIVSDGVVHLYGLIDEEAERQALVVAAENTPGVRRVETRLQRSPAFVGV